MLKCALLRFVLLGMLLLSASACSTLHTTRKETQKLYKEYVEPTPEVNLECENMGEACEVRLAQLMMPVDMRIHSLRRYVDGTDQSPNEEWFQKLFASFPWITGVMVVDTQGMASFQYPPEAALRPLNIQPLLDYGEAWSDHKLRAYSEVTDMGPEVYLASPTFSENVWSGLVIVHFDPRRLMDFCTDPEKLFLVSPNVVLWSGNSEAVGKALAYKPWSEILAEDVFGRTPVGGAEFYWVARTLGHHYLIYATLIEGEVGTISPEELVAPPKPEEEAVEPEVKEDEAVKPVPEAEVTPEQMLPPEEEEEINELEKSPDESGNIGSEYELIMGAPEELVEDDSWWFW